jgi:AcrR family transcriptional regulator
MLERGPEAVSMDAIAEKASASKATIYRWWSSKHELALDALLLEWEGLSGLGRDTGSLRGDLLAIVRPWVKLVSSRPYGRVIAELVAHAHRDDAFARSWRERFLDVRRRRGRAAFVRAIERGEIAVETDVELALDLLFGSLYHRLLHRHAPLNAAMAGRAVDAVLDGVVGTPGSA